MKNFPSFPTLVLCVCTLTVASLLTATILRADDVKPVTAATMPSSSTNRTLSLDVAMLRFKPNSAERVLQGFKNLEGPLASVISQLKPDGTVSVLYYGNREMLVAEKTKMKFDALETRPVILIGKPGAPIPPATAYGMTLEVTARTIEADRVGLCWEGSVTWSPDIVDAWSGEKYLSFIGSAAGAAKQAAVATGIDNKGLNTGIDIGLNFAQLFNTKSNQNDSQIYELPINKTIALASSHNCRNGELVVNATTAEMGNKEAQTILLLIWPTITN